MDSSVHLFSKAQTVGDNREAGPLQLADKAHSGCFIQVVPTGGNPFAVAILSQFAQPELPLQNGSWLDNKGHVAMLMKLTRSVTWTQHPVLSTVAHPHPDRVGPPVRLVALLAESAGNKGRDQTIIAQAQL